MSIQRSMRVHSQRLCSNVNISARELARPTALFERITSWRASEASETLSGVYKFELVRYVYIYIYICMEVRMSY